MKKIIYTIAALTLMSGVAVAQDEVKKDSLSLLTERVEKNEGAVSKFSKLKFSAYVQAQAEFAQEDGTTKTGKLTSINKDTESDMFTRYGIRRGRLKFEYAGKNAKSVFQLDLTEKGLGLKDAYFQINEPFLKVFGLKLGVFDRPFGDEISYSSSLRESPERTWLYQNLFPDERDLGAMLTIAAPKQSALEGLTLDAGLFSGNGIRQDDNSKLDFIGHLKYNRATSNVEWGLGTSLYYGSVNNADTLLFEVKDNRWVSSTVEANSTNARLYYGIDAQVSISTSWGLSNIRAEYLMGQQPSTKSSFTSTKANSYDASAAFSYMRNFMGWHVYFVQDIYRLPMSVVVKYSWADANTDLAGNEITNKTDLAQSSLGLGLLYRLNSNVRLMAYYDIISNETTNQIEKYSKDLKDNVFTLRLQYKF